MTTNSPTLELACELIRRPSVTPEDAGCQELLIERLEALGFRIERLPFEEVTNLWARRGSEGPCSALPDIPTWFPRGRQNVGAIPPSSPLWRMATCTGAARRT